MSASVSGSFFTRFGWGRRGRQLRCGIFLAALAAGGSCGTGLARADEPIWPSGLRRVDLTRQNYERLPARQSAASAQPQKTDAFRLIGFFRVHDSTTFSYKGARYRLAGIAPIPNAQICARPDGSRWPCGLEARNELSNMIKARDIRCVPLEHTSAATRVRCGNEDYDVGAELVSRGFATAVHTAK